MKIWKIVAVIILIASLFIGNDVVEKWTLRSMTISDFTESCNGDFTCIEAIEAQADGCLEKAKWKEFLEDKDNEAKGKYFAETLTHCFVDAKGKPYFPPQR
jgi:hypothetical protein